MYAGRIISAPAITTIIPLRMSCISVPAIVVFVPVVRRTSYWSFPRMVPYIDDSRVRGWKKLPRNRHVRRVSYHPRFRSNLSSFRLELPHKQFHGLEDHETSLAECHRKFLELVYCWSESCKQSPSNQRSPRGSYHPPRVAEIDNNGIRLFFLESLC